MRALGAAAALAALSLGGCASTALRSYVGGDVNQIVRRYGPPASQTRLPDGSTAFQWLFAGTRHPAARVPLDSFVPIAVAPPKLREIADSGGLFAGGMCRYTVRARWDGGAALWRVIGYDTPRADCD